MILVSRRSEDDEEQQMQIALPSSKRPQIVRKISHEGKNTGRQSRPQRKVKNGGKHNRTSEDIMGGKERLPYQNTSQMRDTKKKMKQFSRKRATLNQE